MGDEDDGAGGGRDVVGVADEDGAISVALDGGGLTWATRDGVEPGSAVPDVHPATRAAATSPAAAHRTRPACHATPIRIRGWADGVSHRMIDTRLLCGIATQPAVDEPTDTCRKNALPAPWCTGARL